MHASSLCTIIGMLWLGVSWAQDAQELGDWKAIGGDVKGGGFQYLGAMHLPAEDQSRCDRPIITVQISTKGPLPENLAVILFDDKQESFAQIGRSFTHTGKYSSFCENTVEASKTFHSPKRKTRRLCGWNDKDTDELKCGETKSCTKGFRVKTFRGKTTNDGERWYSQRITVSQKQARTWYFSVAQCGDTQMTDFKFRISSNAALPIPESESSPTEEDRDTFWDGYAFGAIGGAGAILFTFLVCCCCAYAIRMCVSKKSVCVSTKRTKSPDRSEKYKCECKKKQVVPVGEAVVEKVVGGEHHTTVVVGHAVVV